MIKGSLKLGDVCEIIKGKTGIMSAKPGAYPMVVTAEERLSSDNYQFDSDNGVVCVPLVSATGHGHASIKRVHFQKGKFALGSILAGIQPKDPSVLSAEYLYYYLSYLKDEILVPLMSGGANVAMSLKSLQDLIIDIPDLDKQNSIVELARQATESMKITVKQNHLLDELPQSIFWSMYDNENTVDRPKLKDICEIKKGTLQSSKAVDGEYTFITASEEHKRHNEFSNDGKALIYAVAASGSLGRAHYYEGKFIASDLTLVITIKKDMTQSLDLRFLQHYLEANRKHIVKQYARGTSKLSIPKKSIEDLHIPLPSIKEQQGVIQNLTDAQKLASLSHTQQQGSLTLMNSLLHQISA